MTTIIEQLSENREPYPEWLRAGPRAFDRSDFFGSRTIYYPGSGGDGQPVKLCAKAHAAHAFVYVDAAYDRDYVFEQLSDPELRLKGYALEIEESVRETDLRPGGWKPVCPRYLGNGRYTFADPFAWFAVFRRKDAEGFGDAHGPERLAGLFVGADGFAIYDALYCQGDGTPAPFLAALQDCGFGGNWNRFGKGGALERISRQSDVLPNYLLVADNTGPWTGYRDTGAAPEPGGQHGHPRHLFNRDGV